MDNGVTMYTTLRPRLNSSSE